MREYDIIQFMHSGEGLWIDSSFNQIHSMIQTINKLKKKARNLLSFMGEHSIVKVIKI